MNCRYLVLFCQWAVSGCTLTVNCHCFLFDSELSDLGGQWGEESRTDGDRHRVDDHREGGQHSGELRLYLDRTGLLSNHRVYPHLLQDLSHQGILQSSQPARFGWPPLEPKRWFLEVCYTTSQIKISRVQCSYYELCLKPSYTDKYCPTDVDKLE